MQQSRLDWLMVTMIVGIALFIIFGVWYKGAQAG